MSERSRRADHDDERHDSLHVTRSIVIARDERRSEQSLVRKRTVPRVITLENACFRRLARLEGQSSPYEHTDVMSVIVDELSVDVASSARREMCDEKSIGPLLLTWNRSRDGTRFMRACIVRADQLNSAR